MAVLIPNYVRRTGSTGRLRNFDPENDQIDSRVMPTAYPNEWSGNSVTYRPGNTVFHGDRVWVARSTHTSNTSNPPSESNNSWGAVGGALDGVTGTTGGVSPSGDSGIRDLTFGVNQSSSHTSPTFHVSTDGNNDADIELRLPQYALSSASGITAVNSDASLAGDGNTDPLRIANFDAMQHTSVLISGQLVSDSPTVTNTPSGYSNPLEYSWETATYTRIFADDGTNERLYSSTDLSMSNLVYTKTY